MWYINTGIGILINIERCGTVKKRMLADVLSGYGDNQVIKDQFYIQYTVDGHWQDIVFDSEKDRDKIFDEIHEAIQYKNGTLGDLIDEVIHPKGQQ